MSINTSKYTNHTKEEIENLLKTIKENVQIGKFVIISFHEPEKKINKLFI